MRWPKDGSSDIGSVLKDMLYTHPTQKLISFTSGKYGVCGILRDSHISRDFGDNISLVKSFTNFYLSLSFVNFLCGSKQISMMNLLYLCSQRCGCSMICPSVESIIISIGRHYWRSF